MTLPIQWAAVKELRTGAPAIMARLVHEGQVYESRMVLPMTYTPYFLKLTIAAMKADMENAVKNPPAV
jgi:hypothetical protein